MKNKKLLLYGVGGIFATYYAWREGLLDGVLSDELYVRRVHAHFGKVYDDYQLNQLKAGKTNRANILRDVGNEAAQVAKLGLPLPYKGGVANWQAAVKAGSNKSYSWLFLGWI